MTTVDEGKQIRSEVLRLRPDRRRRYSDELRARILAWVAQATADGMTEPECSKAIGVKTWRFELWRRAAAQAKSEALALVRVDVPRMEPMGLCLVAPSGHRVEGLALAQVVSLLRDLA